ncbi:MAG TPA: hydroxyethylthiazole kinase [Gemmatimonadaceae bacterium]|nr:hydroxyethylthiazole kinase [Gemmatimonadaceae bacterium]
MNERHPGSATHVAAALTRLRAESPLIHNITNYVVMNSTANALLAVGASPAMVHAREEVADFASISRALVINIGTLSAPWVEAMHTAASTARERGVPWVLDPVGVGATTYRTTTAAELVAHRPAVIRGNASEIMALAGAHAATIRGVDSTQSTDDALESARTLARESGSVVAVTGAVDYVTDGERTMSIANGHPLMARVTGLGCTATAIVGAFLAICDSAFDAAVGGLATIGVAGELAAARSRGPGSLQVELLDALHLLDGDLIEAYSQIAPA